MTNDTSFLETKGVLGCGMFSLKTGKFPGKGKVGHPTFHTPLKCTKLTISYKTTHYEKKKFLYIYEISKWKTLNGFSDSSRISYIFEYI